MKFSNLIFQSMISKVIMLTFSFSFSFFFSFILLISETTFGAGRPEEKKVSWEVLGTLDSKKAAPEGKLKEILNQKVSVQGFMVPLEFSGKKVKEFLLVPFVPNCLHVPPPPANQMIHVLLKKAQDYPENAFSAVEISGKLQLNKKTNQELETSFQLAGEEFTVVKGVPAATQGENHSF